MKIYCVPGSGLDTKFHIMVMENILGKGSEKVPKWHLLYEIRFTENPFKFYSFFPPFTSYLPMQILWISLLGIKTVRSFKLTFTSHIFSVQ